MFVSGFLELYRAGVLARKVYPHAPLQRLLDDQAIGETVGIDMWKQLVQAEAVR